MHVHMEKQGIKPHKNRISQFNLLAELTNVRSSCQLIHHGYDRKTFTKKTIQSLLQKDSKISQVLELKQPNDSRTI